MLSSVAGIPQKWTDGGGGYHAVITNPPFLHHLPSFKATHYGSLSWGRTESRPSCCEGTAITTVAVAVAVAAVRTCHTGTQVSEGRLREDTTIHWGRGARN